MNYNTYLYGIFNPQYLSQFQAQQMEVQRNLEQQKNICDMVKAISDFCEAARKVDADYQQQAAELSPAHLSQSESQRQGPGRRGAARQCAFCRRRRRKDPL